MPPSMVKINSETDILGLVKRKIRGLKGDAGEYKHGRDFSAGSESRKGFIKNLQAHYIDQKIGRMNYFKKRNDINGTLMDIVLSENISKGKVPEVIFPKGKSYIQEVSYAEEKSTSHQIGRSVILKKKRSKILLVKE